MPARDREYGVSSGDDKNVLKFTVVMVTFH